MCHLTGELGSYLYFLLIMHQLVFSVLKRQSSYCDLDSKIVTFFCKLSAALMRSSL